MKQILLSAILVCSLALQANAQNSVVVDQGSVETPRGLGAYDEIAYAFAKGDVITLEADADKLLERIMITLYPSDVLKRVKGTKKTTTTFTVPKEGFVIIRFINDRSGGNTIRYKVTRTPGPGAPMDYNTKVSWEKPVGTIGNLVPKRASE